MQWQSYIRIYYHYIIISYAAVQTWSFNFQFKIDTLFPSMIFIEESKLAAKIFVDKHINLERQCLTAGVQCMIVSSLNNK